MELQSSQSASQSAAPADKASQTETERWAEIIGGSALVLWGLQQRSLRGALTAIAGGSLAYHGATSDKSLPETVGSAVGLDKPLRVEKTVTIRKPAAELYSYWHNFENLPRFMQHLESVQVKDFRRSRWVTKAPLGQTVIWEADIVNDQPNHLIAWASVADAAVENSGFVRFQPAPGDRGTEVKVVLEYSLPGGVVANTLAKLWGEAPEQQIGDDLNRFKQLMETGEIATTAGQPSCR